MRANVQIAAELYIIHLVTGPRNIAIFPWGGHELSSASRKQERERDRMVVRERWAVIGSYDFKVDNVIRKDRRIRAT